MGRDDADVHFNLGFSYALNDQDDLAIASYKEAIRLKPVRMMSVHSGNHN